MVVQWSAKASEPIRPSTNERRRSSRKPYPCEAWIGSPTAKCKSDKIAVSAINLSKHGFAFETPVELPTNVFYQLQLGTGRQRLKFEIRVIACRRLPGGSYAIGAEFC